MVKLGEKVKDSITGFEGTVTARAEYLYGCVRVEVTPAALKDGVPVESQWFDEQRTSALSEAPSGGPQSVPSRQSPPSRTGL